MSRSKNKISKNFKTDHLTPEQKHICCEGGTERAFTGKYCDFKKKGIYECVVCGHPLFSSETKYDSGSGWPSFYQTQTPNSVRIVEDRSHGLVREEAVCSKCGAHLGHRFPDGPAPTGLRYCMNSASLRFIEDS